MEAICILVEATNIPPNYMEYHVKMKISEAVQSRQYDFVSFHISSPNQRDQVFSCWNWISKCLILSKRQRFQKPFSILHALARSTWE